MIPSVRMTRFLPISPPHVKKLTRSLWQKHVFDAAFDSAEWAGTQIGCAGCEEVRYRGVRCNGGGGFWGGGGCRPSQMGPFCWNVKPALSWHAIINLSIVSWCVRAFVKSKVCVCVSTPCIRRKLVACKQDISPSLLCYICDSHSYS